MGCFRCPVVPDFSFCTLRRPPAVAALLHFTEASGRMSDEDIQTLVDLDSHKGQAAFHQHKNVLGWAIAMRRDGLVASVSTKRPAIIS